MFFVAHGKPQNSPTYEKHLGEFTRLMDDASLNHKFEQKSLLHQRGAHPSVHFGTSMGKGTTEPCYSILHRNAEVIERLKASDALCHLAGYSDCKPFSFSPFSTHAPTAGVFSLWQPRLYEHYRGTLDSLYELRPQLRSKRNFPGHSILPASTLNFGVAESYKHLDTLNLAYGVCTIQSAGNFDHQKGGQLILWDCKVAIDFPAGCTVLVPSAVLTHSNAVIQAGESRHSFTQYCAGGIFRWVDEGGETDQDIKKSNPERYAQLRTQRAGRWKMGLGLLATVDELQLSLSQDVM